MQMHLRDARRDGKLPPSNHTNLQGLMNMVHIDAIHDSNDDFEAVDEISQIRPRPLSAPSSAKKQMTVEEARISWHVTESTLNAKNK